MANNRILTLPEAHADVTIIKWADSGGDEVITLASLATVTGRNGALHDFGDAARGGDWNWVFFCQFLTSTPPVVNDTIEIYWRHAVEDTGAKHPTNDDGTGDTALSSTNKLKNLMLLGVLTVDEAAADTPMSIGGRFRLPATHGGPTIYNATADTLTSTAANNGFWMWEDVEEIE